MITVKRFNKVLSIDETEKSTYTTLGYDVVELDEKKKEYKVIEYAAGNDKIDISKYNKLADKISNLEKELKEHEQKDIEYQKTHDEMEKEHEKLKSEHERLLAEYRKIAK